MGNKATERKKRQLHNKRLRQICGKQVAFNEVKQCTKELEKLWLGVEHGTP